MSRRSWQRRPRAMTVGASARRVLLGKCGLARPGALFDLWALGRLPDIGGRESVRGRGASGPSSQIVGSAGQLYGPERRIELLADPVGWERGGNVRGSQYRGPESECEFGSLGAECKLSTINLRNLVVSLCSQGGLSWKPVHCGAMRILRVTGRGGGMPSGCHRACKLFGFSTSRSVIIPRSLRVL